MKRSMFVLFTSLMVSTGFPQKHGFSWDTFQADLTKNHVALSGTLTAWSSANILYSGTAAFLTQGKGQKFHYVNIGWNMINLAIGIPSLVGNLKKANKVQVPKKLFQGNLNTQKILLINAALDVAYVGTGALLWPLGIEKENDWLVGMGIANVLNGGFLLILDTTFAILHIKGSRTVWEKMNENLQFTGSGLSYRF